MANAPSPPAGPQQINIGEMIMSLVKQRLEAVEAADAKESGEPAEPVDLNDELSRAKQIKFFMTTDGQVWRRDKASPNMKSGAYQILVMFRYTEPVVLEAGDPDEGTDPVVTNAYAGIRVYLIPVKQPPAGEEAVLLSYDIAKSRIDFVADEFRDVETFAATVAGEILASIGVDAEDEDEEPEEPEGPGAPANGAGTQVAATPS